MREIRYSLVCYRRIKYFLSKDMEERFDFSYIFDCIKKAFQGLPVNNLIADEEEIFFSFSD